MMDYVLDTVKRYPALEACRNDIQAAVDAIVNMYESGSKLLLCGNGGSAADSEHISGELLKGFLKKRPYSQGELELDDEILSKLQKGISAIPLTSLSASLTAFNNDVDPDLNYAQLVQALGRMGDVFMGISTSGNAKNVAYAAKTANAVGMLTIGLTGEKGGLLKEICDITIRVPENETYKIQELHLPVYHAICAQVEEEIFER
jgi:D-sedoheptulose 7-phosphate isomerase